MILLRKALQGRGSLLQDFSTTFVTQIIVLVGTTLTYGLVSRFLGFDELGAYMLVRRVVTSVQPTVLLGLAVAVPRYIATVAEGNDPKRGLYALAGSSVMLGATIFFVAILWLFPNLAVALLFGSGAYQNLLLPLSIMTLGAAAHAIVYCYYRGRLLMNVANLLQVANLGVIPFALVAALRSRGAGEILMLTGVANLLVTSAFSPLLIRDGLAACRQVAQVGFGLKKAMVELLRYGLPRVPGLLAANGLLVLGPVLAAHYATMKAVAYLNAGQGLLQMMAAFAAPLGLVILPRFSHLLAQGKRQQVQVQLETLISGSIHVAAFLMPQLLVFTGPLLALWLGPEGAQAESVVRLLIIPLPFYLLYEILRNPIDAGAVRALNARNAYLSLALFLVAGFMSLRVPGLDTVVGLAVSFSVSLCVLGIVTYWTAKNLFGLAFMFQREWLYVLLGVALGCLACMARLYLDSRSVAYDLTILLGLVLFEGAVSVVYFGVLAKARVKWLQELWARLRSMLPG